VRNTASTVYHISNLQTGSEFGVDACCPMLFSFCLVQAIMRWLIDLNLFQALCSFSRLSDREKSLTIDSCVGYYPTGTHRNYRLVFIQTHDLTCRRLIHPHSTVLRRSIAKPTVGLIFSRLLDATRSNMVKISERLNFNRYWQ
jgi:hypothetical protein